MTSTTHSYVLFGDPALPGTQIAVACATVLIQASCWFECMPLPDDQWEFTVKDEPRPRQLVEHYL